MCMSNDLVVFSIDLTITRSFGVIGELASLRGLKFKMTFNILFAVRGRARTSTERELSVALIKTVFLQVLVIDGTFRVRTYMALSWNIPSTLSRRPDASASKLRGGMSG